MSNTPLPDPTVPFAVLSIAQVAKRVSRSEFWVRRAVHAGRFPAPRRMGGRNVWLAADLSAFVANLPAGVIGRGQNDAV
jgi:predicted DNA-binding transcriptional regulator AlpA